MNRRRESSPNRPFPNLDQDPIPRPDSSLPLRSRRGPSIRTSPLERRESFLSQRYTLEATIQPCRFTVPTNTSPNLSTRAQVPFDPTTFDVPAPRFAQYYQGYPTETFEMMDPPSRRPNLPTGRPGDQFIPPYLNLYQHNTSSTGSDDSIRTQVPLPFHLPQDQLAALSNSNQGSQRYTGSPLTTPWATPVLPPGNLPATSKPLNPSSSEFTPGAGFREYQNFQNYRQGSHQGSRVQQPYQPDNFNFNANALAFGQQPPTSIYQHGQAQIGQAVPYPSNYQSGQGQIGQAIPYPSNYQSGQHQIGQAVPYSNNNMYSSTSPYGGSSQLQQPFGTQQVGSSDHYGGNNTPTGGYGGPSTQNQHFNNGPSSMNSYAGHLARRGQAQPGPAQPGPAQPGPAQPGPAQPGPAQPGPAQPAQPGPAQQGYSGPGTMRPYGGPLSSHPFNGYEGLPPSFGPSGGSGNMNANPNANMGHPNMGHGASGGTGGGMNSFNAFHARIPQTYGAFLESNKGSVFPELTNPKSTDAPTLETAYDEKNKHLSGSLSNLGSSKAKGSNKLFTFRSPKKDKSKGKENFEDVQTPGAKPRSFDLEFNSEPRKPGDQTPILRSSRGKTIATVPSKKNSITQWLKTPTGEHPKTDAGDQRATPAKLLEFTAPGGTGTNALSTITENDPFVSTSQIAQRPSASNPFQPITALSGPFGNSVVAGQPQGMSRDFAAFTKNGTHSPTLAEALDVNNLPFVEHCRMAQSEDWGVIKITNIPYSVTRAEVLAFIGRNARIISEQEHEPIHIIMERVTSKTLDCYVEFTNLNEAVNAVNRFENNRIGGRGTRLGQRHVEVELSSQAALMKELFPKAKNIFWHGSRPEIIPREPNDIYNSGFQGFVSSEELVMLVKHVEAPQRSPFSKECPQRPFECLISTLLKYPWYMVDFITIEDRDKLYEATKTLLFLLMDRVNNEVDTLNLSAMLMKRLWRACLKCAGFTPVMKDNIACYVGIDPGMAAMLGVPYMAHHWGPLWTIGPKPGVPNDMVMWYIGKLRASAEPKEDLSLAEKIAHQEKSKNKVVGIFGHFAGDEIFNNLRLDLPPGRIRLDKATLGDVARYEWFLIERALRQTLN